MIEMVLIIALIVLNLVSICATIYVIKKNKNGKSSLDTTSLENQIYNNNKMLMDGINNNLMTTHNSINNLTMLQKQEI